MRLQYLLLGTVLALGSVSAANAATTPHGWYLSLGAGANWVEDGDIREVETGFGASVDPFSWDTGFIGAGAIGYSFDNHWRAEFEVAYRHNNADSFCEVFVFGTTCGEPVGDMHVWELSQMLNVMYDFDLGGNWSASAGAGIGGNLVVFHPDSAGFFDSAGAGVNADDYVFAGQLVLQAAYQFAARWQLYLDYHFMLMEDPSMTDPGQLTEVWEMEKTDHSVLLGVRFDLQREGPPPAPPMAAPPPPPPGPRQFIVFFAFNKYNLTPEAARVVADAAEEAKATGSATIVVVGHTDSSGSPKYNLRLSMKRSSSVKDELVADGVPAAAISTSGKGESELTVQTGDGVKEPQNRRATVDLH